MIHCEWIIHSHPLWINKKSVPIRVERRYSACLVLASLWLGNVDRTSLLRRQNSSEDGNHEDDIAFGILDDVCRIAVLGSAVRNGDVLDASTRSVEEERDCQRSVERIESSYILEIFR